MTLLLKDRQPDVWRLTDIWDPDVDTGTPEASGKFIPAVGSIVLDMLQPPTVPIPAYVVVAVDEITFKSTLRPLSSILELGAVSDRILSYGNDIMMLYYDNRETPTRLRIDSNLLILGDNSSEYILYMRDNGTGLENPISMNIDNTGHVVSERIPIVETATPGVRRGNDCYTSVPLVDGNLVEMRVFDASGVQIMSLQLVIKRSDVLNDLESGIDVITGFNVTANQEKLTGEMIVFTGQNKEDLAIFPELEFSTGEKLTVPVDNMTCFMYGWEDVKTDIPGYEFEILFKYYLTPNLLTTLNGGGNVRFVTTTKTLIVEGLEEFGYSKVSPIVVFDGVNYQLRYFAYYNERHGYKDITADVTYPADTFDGTPASFGVLQNLTIQAEMLRTDGSTAIYEQSFCITTNVHNGGVYPNFMLQDEPDSVLIFGANDVQHNTPVIKYDADPSIEQYFFPTSEFIDVDRFIEFFYTNAQPPYLIPDESIAPTPTHFTIRNAYSGAVLLPNVTAVEDYAAAFSLIVSGGNPGELNNSTVVVEFLLEVAPNDYLIIYGVPVEISSGNYIP